MIEIEDCKERLGVSGELSVVKLAVAVFISLLEPGDNRVGRPKWSAERLATGADEDVLQGRARQSLSEKGPGRQQPTHRGGAK